MANQEVFYNGTLGEVSGKLIQVGHKCQVCGRISFPQTEACTYCGSDAYEDAPLLTEGTLYSYSVCRRPVGPYVPPIVAGFVDFADGTRVYGQIKADETAVKKGMKLKAEVEVLYTKEDGTEVMGYRYVPVDESNGGAK